MKIAMLFPGYGSQFVGMAKDLYDESRIMQEYFEEASNCLNVNFVKLCFASSDVEIGKMPNAYTATFLVSCSLHALLKEQGITPQLVAGYNFGEYAALFAANGFSFPDGLYLLNKFATFYQEALTTMDVGVLHVTGMPTRTLQTLCKKVSEDDVEVRIGIFNTPTDHIVTGYTRTLTLLRQELSDHHAVTVQDLPVEVGLHSPLMHSVAENLAVYLEKVDFKDLSIPLLSTLDTVFIVQGGQVKQHVIDHIHSSIKWDKVMDQLDEYDLLIEVGPGSRLSAIVKEKYPDKLTISINKKADLIDLKKIIETSTNHGDLNGGI